MFTNAGHEVYSLGDYWNRATPVSDARPFNPDYFNDSHTQAYLDDPACNRETRSVSPRFCQRFDLVIASGVEVWMHENFASFGDMPVVFRTIGQSNLASEKLLAHRGDRIRVVRYSPREAGLPGFARTDAIIYFGKDPADFPAWKGGGGPVTFHSHFAMRDEISAPQMHQYKAVADGLGALLYGINDDKVPNFGGHLHHSEQGPAMARAGCYLYVWSQPPSYTLSLIEAMMVGLPVVAPSARFVAQRQPDLSYGWTPERYEVDAILADGCGFTYDSLEEARFQVQLLLEGGDLAQRVSKQSRERALQMFGIRHVSAQWDVFLSGFLGDGQ